MSSLVCWLLHDTPLALSRQAGENLKRGLLTLRFMAGKYQYPWGSTVAGPSTSVTRWLTPPRPSRTWPTRCTTATLGAAFARLWDARTEAVQHAFAQCGESIYWGNSPGALPWLLDAAARYRPEADPSGHRAYPFAAMDFHRRRQWVASVRGWSQYVWNYEAAADRNRYGRYTSHGTLQIFSRGDPVNREASG